MSTIYLLVNIWDLTEDMNGSDIVSDVIYAHSLGTAFLDGKKGFFYMGRGAGKDGLISWMSLALISPYNPVPNYDVDICAFNEDQALRPVEDVYNSMESNVKKMKKHFRWTKESIRGIKNRGIYQRTHK